MSNDLISRQAAIDELHTYFKDGFEQDRWWNSTHVLKAIRGVLSAQRKGKWIMHIDDMFPVESTMECSECHHEQSLIIDDNFCPNCGAEMKGEEDECNTNDNTGN